MIDQFMDTARLEITDRQHDRCKALNRKMYMKDHKKRV